MTGHLLLDEQGRTLQCVTIRGDVHTPLEAIAACEAAVQELAAILYTMGCDVKVRVDITERPQ
jgi:hypothetical protein